MLLIFATYESSISLSNVTPVQNLYPISLNISEYNVFVAVAHSILCSRRKKRKSKRSLLSSGPVNGSSNDALAFGEDRAKRKITIKKKDERAVTRGRRISFAFRDKPRPPPETDHQALRMDDITTGRCTDPNDIQLLAYQRAPLAGVEEEDIPLPHHHPLSLLPAHLWAPHPQDHQRDQKPRVPPLSPGTKSRQNSLKTARGRVPCGAPPICSAACTRNCCCPSSSCFSSQKSCPTKGRCSSSTELGSSRNIAMHRLHQNERSKNPSLSIEYRKFMENYLKLRHMENFPLDSKAALKDFSVDDLRSGANSTTETVDQQIQLIKMLSSAGFVLRKWVSNCNELTNVIEEELSLSKASLSIDNDTVKILDVLWHPTSDVFFSKSIYFEGFLRKRTLFSKIAKTFGPLGWLSPITIHYKLLLQKLGKYHLQWDKVVPPDIAIEWKTN
ncbi:reverse transcriptase [Caerostris darwini]|uniref:Reverse transcriptase n=1 Tax=Caerostris darwini TaxID=1538125 RepID=A0AAV4RTC7_9ARAC|nr:reverse transcriptase [Caerostris darwini]